MPESPRWQIMHGRVEAAEEIGYFALARVLFREYPSRAVLGATLMITQSFLYNAIFFTYTGSRQTTRGSSR